MLSVALLNAGKVSVALPQVERARVLSRQLVLGCVLGECEGEKGKVKYRRAPFDVAG
jgi:hypothetical protein